MKLLKFLKDDPDRIIAILAALELVVLLIWSGIIIKNRDNTTEVTTSNIVSETVSETTLYCNNNEPEDGT